MRIKFVRRKYAFWLLLCFFTYITATAQSEIITIEEFIQTINPAKSVDEAFSYELGDKIIGHQYSNRYFAARTAHSISIFDAKDRIQNFPVNNSLFLINRFLEEKGLVFASAQREGEDFMRGLFRLDGTPVKTYSIPDIYPSPGGEFFYTPCSMLGTHPIIIYDYDGEMLFQIPITYACQVTATSDLRLIVLHHKSLSLWDFNAMGKIWESNIPRDDYYTDSAFKITHSVKNDIIVVRDMFSLHCFDFQGNFLWGHEGLGDNKYIDMVGVSNEDGRVAVSAIETDMLRVNQFSREGELLEESTIDLGPNCRYSVSVNPGIANVFQDFVLLGFKARCGQEKKRVTGILYRNGAGWISAVIDGAWYLLRSSENDYVLIGIDGNESKISAFSIRY